jgi:xylulokinase
MKHPLLLGVDLGTTATKAALYHPGGALVAEAREEVPIRHIEPGWVEQDLADFYRSAACAVRRCVAASAVDPAKIAAVAFDSQMAGVGAIDEHFEPAAPFDSWLDMRCRPFIEQLSRDHAERITALSGCPPTCDHGPKMMWWMHERPDDYRRIAKFVMPSCYVAGRLAGLRADQAYIDYTFLHFTTLADAQAGGWSAELCGILGVDTARLPRIVTPWEVIGEAQSGAAQEFGLRPGTLIAAGCGDTAAGALGAGVVKPGMLLDTAGTAAVLACSTGRFVADTEHRALITMRSVVEGVWNPLAYIAGGGLALRWFRDNWSAADGNYDSLFELAVQAPPGCDGLMFSPHLGGRICPAAPEMRGAWIGFSWSHTPAHFCRAIVESVGYEYAYYLSILTSLLPDLEIMEARVIGGGARSPVWNQVKSDILQTPYRRVTRVESATWGAALIAGKAAGVVEDLAGAALACAPVSGATCRPDVALRPVYRAAFERYRRWQEQLQKGFEH